MKKKVRKKLKENKGITLIALVITIIVLLILAGVSLSAVLSQDGIFRRAEQATDKYGQAKARETLELAFGTLQAEKYEARLTIDALDARITEEIGKMGGEETGENKNEVIVDGYRFLVDRTVPKILEELGPADGVIISAVVTPNGDWTNPKSTVTGIIKTYSGGTITSSTAEVIKGNADISSFPSNGGNFTIADISEDTDIKITATDSNNKTNTRTIKVVIVDGIPILELKKILKADATKYPDYLGTKVAYGASGTWRLFYYDINGEFGDGAGTIYLKRDYDAMLVMTISSSHPTAAAKARFEQLNKAWVTGAGNTGSEVGCNKDNERVAANLCDGTNSKWSGFKTTEAKWIIGAAPIEMWCKAQNAYKTKYDTNVSTIGCGIKSARGYGYTINGGSLVDYQNTTVVNTSTPQSTVIATGDCQWLASPSSGSTSACYVTEDHVGGNYYGGIYGVCPVVCLKN